MKNLERLYQQLNHLWDVIIIGGNNCPPYDNVSDYAIRVYNNQTTTGYIVKSHYYDILCSNIKEGVKNLIREPNNARSYAIDMYWKKLQRMHHWYMIVPPTVIQYNGYSDVEKHSVNYTDLMLDLDKVELIRRQHLNGMSKMQFLAPSL
jgi:hypothetical protein